MRYILTYKLIHMLVFNKDSVSRTHVDINSTELHSWPGLGLLFSSIWCDLQYISSSVKRHVLAGFSPRHRSTYLSGKPMNPCPSGLMEKTLIIVLLCLNNIYVKSTDFMPKCLPPFLCYIGIKYDEIFCFQHTLHIALIRF